MPMNAEIKAQWTAALRSGEYQQGRGYLNADDELCCLGVLCELAVKAEVIDKSGDPSGLVAYNGKTDILPDAVLAWAGLPEDNIYHRPHNPVVAMDGELATLAELNDGEDDWERHSFAQIADIIDEQL